MILIYAFSNQWATNISRRVLSELQKLVKNNEVIFLPINSYPQNFYKKYIENNKYSLIIGLGDGSKSIDKIKIETQAKNTYNNQSISPFSPILIDLNLPNVDIYDSQNFKISDNMGSYNCNWLAYKTQLYLNNHSPDTFHLFIHLPQNQNALQLATNIANLISDNEMLK